MIYRSRYAERFWSSRPPLQFYFPSLDHFNRYYFYFWHQITYTWVLLSTCFSQKRWKHWIRNKNIGINHQRCCSASLVLLSWRIRADSQSSFGKRLGKWETASLDRSHLRKTSIKLRKIQHLSASILWRQNTLERTHKKSRRT